MIYKIMGNFDENNFNNILNSIKTKYKILYKNNNLYIALKSYQENYESKELQFIKKICKHNNFIFIEINEKNIMREDEEIINWCRDNFVRLEEEKYQVKNQKKLKEIMDNLDKMEKILKEQKLRKEG